MYSNQYSHAPSVSSCQPAASHPVTPCLRGHTVTQSPGSTYLRVTRPFGRSAVRRQLSQSPSYCTDPLQPLVTRLSPAVRSHCHPGTGCFRVTSHFSPSAVPRFISLPPSHPSLLCPVRSHCHPSTACFRVTPPFSPSADRRQLSQWSDLPRHSIRSHSRQSSRSCQ